MSDRKDWLKHSKNLWEPDPGALMFGVQEPTVDLYVNWMKEAVLSENVPNNIVQYFDSARNSFIYSFYYYGMSMPAQLYAFSIVERALKKRFAELGIKYQDGSGLGSLFKVAKANGFLLLNSFNGDEESHHLVHNYSHFWADHGSSDFKYKEPHLLEKLFQGISILNRTLNMWAARWLKAFRIRGRFNEKIHKGITYCTQKMKTPLRKVSKVNYKIQQRIHESKFPPFEGKRNLLAHGDEIMDLPWEAYHTILLCAHVINSLYHPTVKDRF